MGGKGVWGGGGGGGRDYLSLHCHHRKMGSGESQFNVSVGSHG